MQYFNRFFKKISVFIFSVLLLFACRENYDYVNYGPIKTGVQEPENIDVKGLYILNEGNMGSNKASLDYFDYETGVFTGNYYNAQNPNVVNSLGDVGNDIKIYKNKLFAVINLSNYVEVMDAKTAKHIGEIKVQNCRSINFHGDYAYVSSYGGAVGQSQPGYIIKVDVNTLEIKGKLFVGKQPEELEVVGDRLYVANSGGYDYPNYDNTVSVVDLNTFTEIKKVTIAINLNKIRKDANGNLWISSRGNYNDISAKIYIYNPISEHIIKIIDEPISDFSFVDNRMLFLASTWTTSGTKTYFGVYNTDNYQKFPQSLISQKDADKIVLPYAITVNPANGDVFVADAKDYVSPGEVFCFNKFGKFKWKATTGDLPGHFAFLFN